MNLISSFFTAFCAAAVFIGGLYMLCPDGAMSKSVKYLLSLVFLVTIISAAGLNLRKSDINIDFSVKAETNTTDLEVESARYVYSYALKSAGINFKKIEIFTDKAANDSISINKVIIYSECERETILKALNEAAKNIEVEIINE